jgi:integrase/recombinase XerC
LIQSFFDFLQFEKRYSSNTIRGYEDDVRDFFDFAVIQYGETEAKSISPAIVRSWLASLKDKGMHSRSVNRKISALKSYFKYQVRVGEIEQSPMVAISSPKASKRLPVFVEETDMASLLGDIPFPDTWEGRTDRLILAIFYNTGMRLSELVGLRESQTYPGQRMIKVLGKGKKERLIPVSPALAIAIAEYCEKKRNQFEDPDNEYLLVNKSGKRLYPKYLYRAVRKWLSEVTTIDQRSPHILRHSFATHLMNEGAELNSVKELLGHASLAATQVYTHNTIEKLKDIHKKSHPKP